MTNNNQGGSIPFIRPPRRQRRPGNKMVFSLAAELARQLHDAQIRFERATHEWRSLNDDVRPATRRPTLEDFLPREGTINPQSLGDVIPIGEPSAGPPDVDLGEDTIGEEIEPVGPPALEPDSAPEVDHYDDDAPLYKPASPAVPAVPVPEPSAATKRAAKRTSAKNEDRDTVQEPNIEIP